MKLQLQRHTRAPHSTLGDLYINGFYQCHTCEDVVRAIGPNGEGKIPGETAIPAGTYRVILNESPRFKRIMPRLLNVPHFDGILIHKGNTDADTHGCILVGRTIKNDGLVGSTLAYNELYEILLAAQDRHEPIEIEVLNMGFQP